MTSTSILQISLVMLPVLAMALVLPISYAKHSENLANRACKIVMSGLLLGSSCLLFFSGTTSTASVHMYTLYEFQGHHFDIILQQSRITFLLAFFFVVIISVTALFSANYLHRDDGYWRFQAFMYVYTTAVLVVVYSGNLDTLLIGWEVVGLSSVFLIAYYFKRDRPVQNAFYTLVHYRLGGVFLLAAIFIEVSNIRTDIRENFFVLFLILAAFVKSAQLPFSTWLPRAMEGPTPSSAIFYGGISVHLGPILLLKHQEAMIHAPIAQVILGVGGLLTAFYAAGVGRTKTDIKNQLAYATMGQLGVIYMEIALGFYTLSIIHIILHCSARTFQFLKSPSILHDHHVLKLERSKQYFELLLPKKARNVIYYLSIHEFLLPQVIKILITKPFFKLVSLASSIDRSISKYFKAEDCSDLQTKIQVENSL